LANVSHELRTPLNSILLLSKLLAAKESGLDPDQRRQAQVINEAGGDLRAMIDNVLDISRIEAGAVTVSLEWIEVHAMLDELVTMIGPIFTDKGLTVRLDINPAAPARIYSDRDKLRQIVKNFLSNAAKFTERGGVVITVTPAAEPRPLAISVIDSGIGIPPGKEEIIFDAFQQADGSTRRRFGGTGLGLSISRELATLLGGQIEVQSTYGQGSRFTLHLPRLRHPRDLDAVEIIERHDHDAVIERRAAAPSRPSPTAAARGLPQPDADADPTDPGRGDERWVLLVERDVQTLVAVTGHLEGMGFAVQTAANGEEALETLADEAGCALLLLAAPASAMETCDTIKRIRCLAGYESLPIVIVGNPDPAQQQRCRKAGACGFLDRPIDLAELTALLEREAFAEGGMVVAGEARDAAAGDRMTA
jgi:CheY-like chemotaxis protein